jgi:hypothetical protein
MARVGVLKWSLFILLAGQLLKLQLEARPPDDIDELHKDGIVVGRDASELNATDGALVWVDSNETDQIYVHSALEQRNATSGAVVATGTKTTEKQTGEVHLSPQKKQRIVILPGPHKSASTSVQAYLVQLAKEGVLVQHSWSWLGKRSRKGFSGIARQLLFPPEFGTDEDKLNESKQVAEEEWSRGNSLIIAAEFMDYVASLTEDEAETSIGRLIDWLPTDAQSNVEVVVMYRSPRASHLVSAWKQQVQFRKTSTTLPWRESLVDGKPKSRKKFGEPPTLAEWLCYATYTGAMKYDVETILSAQLNPFGVAYAYNSHAAVNVTFIDMTGVPEGDVPSSVTCDILGLPCQDGKLAAGQETESVQKNHRSESTELGMDLTEAEEIIRDMDCHYYCLLGENGVKVLHGKDEVFQDGKMSWEKCCQRSKKKEEETNGKWMAKKLIDLGCHAIAESKTTVTDHTPQQ